MDVFFCISGFVMAHSTYGLEWGPRSAFAFLIKQFFRIVPLYLIATTAMMLWHVRLGDIDNIFVKYLLSIVFLPYHESSMWFDPIIFPGWTLNYEMFFYLMIGLAICISSHFMLVICAAMIGVSIVGMLTQDQIYYLTNVTAEFVFGVGIYFIVHRYKEYAAKIEAYRWPLLAASIGLLAFAMTGWDVGYLGGAVQRMSIVYDQVVVPRWIAWGIPSALLVYAVLLFERQIPKRFAVLGDCSYSFYLLQLFTVAVFARLMLLLPTATDLLSRSGLLAVLLVLAHTAVSYVSFVMLERPFQIVGHKLARRYQQLHGGLSTPSSVASPVSRGSAGRRAS